MLSIAHLRTLFTTSFVALVIAACGSESGDTSPAETPPSNQQSSDNNDGASNEIEFLSFVFLGKEENPVHGSYYPIDGQPTEETMKANAKLSGSIKAIEILAIDMQGNTLATMNMNDTVLSKSGIFTYSGELNIPSSPFKIKVTGSTNSSESFSIVYDDIYTKQTLDMEFHDFPALLFAGQEEEIELSVNFKGSQDSFMIKINSSNEELMPAYEDIVTINGSHSVILNLVIPDNISEPTYIRLNASVISTSNEKHFNEAEALITVLPL